MKRIFNITGLCIKEKHYMADTSEKIKEIIEMVSAGNYFTINRPRQFGKTTTLNILYEILSKEYLVILTSFEGVGDDLLKSEYSFCSEIFQLFSDSIKFYDKVSSEALLEAGANIGNFRELSNAITKFINNSNKKVILLIDEADKCSTNKIFLQFLGLLRNKYLSASAGRDITFQSVILAGIHDIKNLKLSIRDDNEASFNSPWNISAKFDIDMSFSIREIESMLTQYRDENAVVFDIPAIAGLIHKFTNGYPYLVSDICKIIDEKPEAVWTEESIYSAVKILLNEKNTLFEDVIKNIQNDDDIKTVANTLLVMGRSINYNPFAYDKGIMYGIFREDNGRLRIHNMIFEELIYNYMIEQSHIREMQIPVSGTEQGAFFIDGVLQLEKILLKFQDFMFEEYRKEDEKFYETHARLIFLSYLKPILNGKGFYFVEPETRENKRLDIAVVFGRKKYIIELKIWNGEKYHEKGREQLMEYLEIQNLKEGYLLVFNFNRNKKRVSEWVNIGNKRLFEVII